MVRILLIPRKAAAISVDTNTESVFVADRGHRNPQSPAGAVRKAQKQVRVIIDRPPRNHFAQFSGHFGNLQTCYKARQLMRVGSQIVKHTRIAAEGRIHSPGSLGVALFFQQLCCPTGSMFHLNDLDLSERAVSDQARSMAHHRIAGVVMGQTNE